MSARRWEGKPGDVFGRLKLLYKRMNGQGKRGSFSVWMCRCHCGSEIPVRQQSLVTGNTKSCGCIQKEFALAVCAARVTHGMTLRPGYDSLKQAIRRCINPKDASYDNYGGRGIKVCRRWLNSVEAFFEDMGERPAGLTLERKDVNGDYSPENCVWADQEQQSNNKRTNVFLEIGGKRQTMKQWARELGKRPSTLYARVRRATMRGKPIDPREVLA